MGKKRKLLLSVLFLFGIATSGFTSQSTDWQKLPLYIGEPEITSLLNLSGPTPITLVGTPHGVYRSSDQGQHFDRVLSLQGNGRRVNYLYSNLLTNASPENILVFAATDTGLFLSQNLGQDWEQIFQSATASDKRCLSVITQAQTIYLATAQGLFYKEFSDKIWQEERSFQNKLVSSLAADEGNIYVATDREIYRLNTQSHEIQEIFSLIGKEAEAVEEKPEETSTDSAWLGQIKEIKTVSDGKTQIYLATIKGIFYSPDAGATWKNLNPEGLPIDAINSLVVLDSSHVFVGTGKGVFQYNGQIWMPVYEGMETQEINFLTNSTDKLYALSHQGIFFMSYEKAFADDRCGVAMPKTNLKSTYKKLEKRYDNEPSVQQVQTMAIKYAEVSPEKITNWRRAAQKKALLPKFSMGLNRSTGELFHWDSGPNPDNLLKGRDYVDWDVSLSWDFGELIWNTDQTSIDSRSKLMVELRDDIMDQITRLYFERRRLQMELTTFTLDAQAKIDRQMRVEELTALIDGLTGGKFSQTVENNTNAEIKDN